ncbi:hypothetical protein K458DRAFT_443203 [Lentithecium fluviatile CBS 122367]|uniref:Major facilitator superfamily (MFS) profile domain-containing protein n=1 Tax=Lentithecium fluviatile CBS 122367 TaxID=1168545 RepID=A0A6G1J090_9PLEO|nr:hypothetical protein K458DRAFT_443203 [Lentithecium fluviatile CBS 122367]
MALQSLCGRIYTLFNIENIFLASLFLFEVGSTVCATVRSSPIFIAGRALSGTGASGILSGVLIIGGRLVPLVKRPLYMSVIMSMYGVAAIAGPLRMLPYLGTMIIAATISGALTLVIRHYVPFMILGSIIFTIACGLISTLTVGSGPEYWISYQLLAGTRFGMAFPIPYSALHVVLDVKSLATANSLLVLFQAFGGGSAVSIAQDVLSNQLLDRLKDSFSTHDAALVVLLQIGAVLE